MNPEQPNRIRFGQIKRGQKFRYQSKTWTRIKGTFALPSNQVGQGQCGWHIEPTNIVEAHTPNPL